MKHYSRLTDRIIPMAVHAMKYFVGRAAYPASRVGGPEAGLSNDAAGSGGRAHYNS